MSEDQTTPNQTTNEDQDNGPSEAELLAMLKQKAATLNIPHSNNIGIEALRKKINEKLAEPEEAPKATTVTEKAPEAPQETPAPVQNASVPEEPVAPMPVEDRPRTPAEIRKKQRDEQMRLVRVRIANMNPSKADLHGEIITVRTKYLGIVKRFVPFGEATDNGWHIPFILYEQLKNRKFLQTTVKKSKNGAQMLPKTRWVPEFSIEVLPDLSDKELKKLASQQAAAAGLED